ncbi:MAG: hypothetical protein QOE70_6745 [Chthoniobacter sp.]|jgi:cell wall-associated NlpC family hydrolase|nr:hypothetical protein [Chthoniobacter sp.]
MRFLAFLHTAFCASAIALAEPSANETADFAQRDRLPQTNIPRDQWYAEKWRGTWGPHPAVFPPPSLPPGADALAWKRARIIAVAKHYLGLPYQHHHIPAWAPPADWTSKMGGPESAGLDCSNFTSWVYNYGLGVKFTSEIGEQADGSKAPGRRLREGEPFAPGDLLFILQQDRARVSHVVIYLDPTTIVDAHGSGVRVRSFKGWYSSHFSHARRIIEK